MEYLVLLVAVVIVFVFIITYTNIHKTLPQEFIDILKEYQVPKNKKVIIFAPHPDDESIACGGIIQQFLKKQNQVYIMLITQGGNKKLVLGSKKNRLREFYRAVETLGLERKNLLIYNYNDGFLNNVRKDLDIQINNIMNNLKPDIIIYPHWLDGNRDHKTIGQICRNIKHNNLTHLRYLVHYNRFPRPYRYVPTHYILPVKSIVKKDPHWINLFLSFDEELQKERAISFYKSQLKIPGLRNLLRSFIRRNEIFSIREF